MEQKIALITGASKGIGRAVAIALASDGYNIWLNYRSDHDGAKEVQDKVQCLGKECHLLPFDVCDLEALNNCLDPLLANNTPYALINNAGYAKDNIFGLMSQDDWHGVMNVHLNGFFNVTRKLVPLMQRKRQGRIVNMVSTSGQMGLPGQVNYSAAKAGLIGATKALARELGKRNVLVNAVAPGFIQTAMTEDIDVNHHLSLIPQGRVGTADEVAQCVRFLCSEMSSYVTGQVLAVNGGLYM